jgi:multidrug resistance efflux pump
MTTDPMPSCANCQRLQAEVDTLRAQLAALQATVEQLQKQLAAARMDSSTSSKPPSSDIVNQDHRQGQPGFGAAL